MRPSFSGMMAGAATIAVLLVLVQPVVATTYSITVKTDAPAYAGTHAVKVTGSVTPAPGPDTGATVRVFNPNHVLVVPGEAPVNATTGAFEYDFFTGGTSAWVTGSYTVNVTWGAYPPTISAVASFTWSPSVVTSTTSTSHTSTTSSASTTSTTHTTSTSTSSSTTSTSTSTSSSPTSTTTSASGGGGVPEFPFQALAATVFTLLVVGLYLVVRQRSSIIGQRPTSIRRI